MSSSASVVNLPIKQCIACGYFTKDTTSRSTIITSHFDNVHLYDGLSKGGQEYKGEKFISLKQPLTKLPDSLRKLVTKEDYHAMRRVVMFWYWYDAFLNHPINYIYIRDHEEELKTGVYCRICTEMIFKNPNVQMGMRVEKNGKPLQMDPTKLSQLIDKKGESSDDDDDSMEEGEIFSEDDSDSDYKPGRLVIDESDSDTS